jgi:hypothetical protein
VTENGSGSEKKRRSAELNGIKGQTLQSQSPSPCFSELEIVGFRIADEQSQVVDFD